MLKLIIIASIFLGIVVVGLGIKVFFSKKKEFPNTHIGGNKNMEKMGISCATSEEPGTCSCQVDGISGRCRNQ